jgi:regulator of sigma E protease
MLDIASSILGFIVAVGVLVTVHEYGHYWVARRLGFKVERFSVGFGRPLARWRGKGPDHTEYWLAAIPLGGYVKLLDEREGPVPEADRERAFNRRPVPHRIAVLLAGPGFNFIFAAIAYWALFVAGVPGLKPVIGAVSEGSVAAEAGLRAQDEIQSIGGRTTETWEHAVLAILDRLLAEGRLEMTVRGTDGDLRLVNLDVRDRVSELTEPDALFVGLGMRPVALQTFLPPVIGDLVEGAAAEQAGFRPGDVVLAAGPPASETRMNSWEDWVEYVRARPGETVPVSVQRDGQTQTLTMTVGANEEGGRTIGWAGVWMAEPAPELIAEIRDLLYAEQRYGLFAAMPMGVEKTWEMTTLTLRFLWRMIAGDVSVKNVAGPIGIATYAGDSAQAGLGVFLSFLAVVSISLGIINLMPVPLLDGGQILYQLAEWVKGAPLSERALIVGQQIGMLFLIVLMTFVIYNDLTRIFG